MHLTVAEARALCLDVLTRHGYGDEDAILITDVLVEAHLWGRPNSGLEHLIHACEAKDRGGVSVQREDAVSAVIDGGGNPGFLVASRAMQLAIAKAKASGLAMVGAHHSFMGGLNGHYVHLAARQDLVAMMCIAGGSRVAPAGGIDPLFGTNPVAFAFPTLGTPIVWDISTGMTNVGTLRRAARLGEALPEGLAIDRDGRPTTDGAAALEGAILAFGGHKGAGLSMVVQCLGILAGGAVVPTGNRGFGYFMLVVDPGKFMDVAIFKARTSELADRVRASRPQPGADAVRVPGERGLAERARHLVEGFDVDAPLHAELMKLAGR